MIEKDRRRKERNNDFEVAGKKEFKQPRLRFPQLERRSASG
jgi:hypothetical protein